MLPWNKKVNSARKTARSNSLKKELLSKLQEAVSELQYEFRNTSQSIESNEVVNGLITTLEAVFVQGLKETFLGRLSLRLASSDNSTNSPRMPEPSFWTFALVFSHRAVITQIESLSQINSEVGRARAWLRHAINDGLLVSYLAAMGADQVSLSVHYEKHAFLRDSDMRDVCLAFLTGIEVYKFNLSVNVSTLNRWQPGPLVLAGVWAASSHIIDVGAEDAAALLDTSAQEVPISFARTLAEPISSPSQSGFLRSGLLNEDEALRLILASTPVSFSPNLSDHHIPISSQDNDPLQILVNLEIDQSNLDNETNKNNALDTEYSPSSDLYTESNNYDDETSNKYNALDTQYSSSNDLYTDSNQSITLETESNQSITLGSESNQSIVQGTQSSQSNIQVTESNQSPTLVTSHKKSPPISLLSLPSREFSNPSPSPEPIYMLTNISGDMSPEPSSDNSVNMSPEQGNMSPEQGNMSPELQWDNPSDEVVLGADSGLSATSLAQEMVEAEIANYLASSREESSPDVFGDSEEQEVVPELEEKVVINVEEGNEELNRTVKDVHNTMDVAIELVGPKPSIISPGKIKDINVDVDCDTDSSDDESDISCRCSSTGPRPNCRVCSQESNFRPYLLSGPLGSAVPDSGVDLIAAQTERARRLGSDGQILGFGANPPHIRVASLNLTQNISLTSCLDLVSQEAGLDTQDWKCHDCGKAIGTIFGPGLVCEFTKKYFCSDCHNNVEAEVIPARLLYNWDATRYKISRTSSIFLRHVSIKPFIDIRSFNPGLSKFVPSLDISYNLRKQLTYMTAYLTACSRAGQEGVQVSLAESVWPREYLYSDTNMYSVRDLEQLHSGELLTTLRGAVKLCKKHVLTCLICSGRGFLCELCEDKKPVYPFDLDTVSQCGDCHTVFHSDCSKGQINCPRCERLEARSLKWLVTNSKLTREIHGS